MNPVTIGDATLYLGDCREILPSLPKVDAVVTDPPYNKVNRESHGLRSLDKGGADSLPVNVEQLVELSHELLPGSLYFWCGTEQVSAYRRSLEILNYSTRQCVWWKTNPPVLNGQHLWLSAVELCVYAKGKSGVFNRNCEPPVWRGPTEREQVHPTQKPLWLMSQLIDASTCYGQSVLDPFMGSGTTGVACANLGRRFIGIEIEPRYYEIAVERITAAYAQQRLFA